MDYRGERSGLSLKNRCRQLRKEATPAERRLWECLRAKGLDGWKFRRQHQLGSFILDFYCAACRLAVEVDGAGHATAAGRLQDEVRTRCLEESGVRVLRIRNEEVLRDIDAVLEKIRMAAEADWDEEPRGRARIVVMEPDFVAASPFR